MFQIYLGKMQDLPPPGITLKQKLEMVYSFIYIYIYCHFIETKELCEARAFETARAQ